MRRAAQAEAFRRTIRKGRRRNAIYLLDQSAFHKAFLVIAEDEIVDDEMVAVPLQPQGSVDDGFPMMLSQ